MKKLLFLLLAGNCLMAAAQTNAPALSKKVLEQTFLTSDTGFFDGNKREMIYLGHVFVSDPKVKLTCEWLAVNLPAEGQPTNIVAETNVVIDFVDQKGQTNHVTSDKAVYAYSVVNSVTNETVTFTGNPRVENPDVTILSEPLVWDRAANQFHFTNEKMIPRRNFETGNGTNSSPFNLLK
jgi:lipopolysaccharide export system protein LptA